MCCLLRLRDFSYAELRPLLATNFSRISMDWGNHPYLFVRSSVGLIPYNYFFDSPVVNGYSPSLTTSSAFQTPALSCRHSWPDLTNIAVHSCLCLDPEAKNVAHKRYSKKCNVATPATHISISGSLLSWHKEARP